MAERERGFWSRFRGRRASTEDITRLNELVNSSNLQNPFEWDGKALASLSKIGQASGKASKKSKGMDTEVEFSLLRSIATKSEIVNAIIRRCVDDTLSNGYEFVLADGKESGDESQLAKVRQFFKNPNPDDMGDEWLESMLYDLVLFGNAYLELDGSSDGSRNDGQDWNYGGDLVSIWPIPADTIKVIPSRQKPRPPAMAYIQSVDREVRRFDTKKVIHVCKFKQGDGYGMSPLLPLMEVIAGQLNLSNYLNALYTGTLPKTILNVGDISNSEMKAMLGLIEQQLAGGKSPFGLIAINGGSGFNMHRLIDSTREGAQLDLLYYYREEICAVFGIPPMKLGWVQTGKMANPEQQLDSWYDVVDGYHARVSAVINNSIMPLLGITDWKFKFVSIRPKRETERAETLKARAEAVATLRQEGAISVNEAREILGFQVLTDNADADDPFYLSPKLSINKGKDVHDDVEDAPATISDLFPPPEVEQEEMGEFPAFDEPQELGIDVDTLNQLARKNVDDRNDFDQIIDEGTEDLILRFNANHSNFADRLLSAYDEMFDADDKIELSASDVKTKAINQPALTYAIDLLDREAQELLDSQTVAATTALTAGFDKTLAELAANTQIAISFTQADALAIDYWTNKWIVPALRNTLGAYRATILYTFDQMNARGESWDWASRRMRDFIDPKGSRFPKYYYERIARTETARVVENAHLSGLKKTGFQFVQRLVTVDSVTDKDLCAPFENEVYPIDKSGGVVPAHPNCRCTFVAYIPEDEATPQAPLSDSEILAPDVEGAEIIDLG